MEDTQLIVFSFIHDSISLRRRQHDDSGYALCRFILGMLDLSVWCPSPGALPTNYPDPDPESRQSEMCGRVRGRDFATTILQNSRSICSFLHMPHC